MKSVKTIFSIVLVSSMLGAKAQSVTYNKLVDDPNDIAKLTVHLDPFYAETWGTNISLGYGLRADYQLKKAIFSFDLRKSYLETKSSGTAGQIFPADPLQNFRYVELGAAWHFADKEISGPLKIVLSSSTSGNTTYSKYIMVPSSFRKIKTLRVGIQHIRSAFKVQDSKATATPTGPTYDIKGYSGTDTKEFEPYVNAYSMMNMPCLYAGISFKRITNLVIKAEIGTKMRKRENASVNDFYFDFMFAPVISYADVVTPDTKVWELKNGNEKHTGWRVGWSLRSSSLSRISLKIEFGSRPGFYGNGSGVLGTNLYMLFGTGWSIPFKLK